MLFYLVKFSKRLKKYISKGFCRLNLIIILFLYLLIYLFIYFYFYFFLILFFSAQMEYYLMPEIIYP